MKFRTLAAVAAVSSLVVAPAIAADRSVAPVSGESELAGGGIVLALLAAAAVIGAIVIAADSGDLDEPVSA